MGQLGKISVIGLWATIILGCLNGCGKKSTSSRESYSTNMATEEPFVTDSKSLSGTSTQVEGSSIDGHLQPGPQNEEADSTSSGAYSEQSNGPVTATSTFSPKPRSIRNFDDEAERDDDQAEESGSTSSRAYSEQSNGPVTAISTISTKPRSIRSLDEGAEQDDDQADLNPSPSPPPSQKTIIVAFGDSQTRGADPCNSANTGVKGYAPTLQDLMGEQFAILNCGIGGETTSGGLARIVKILEGDYGECTLDIKETCSDGKGTKEFYNYSAYQGQKPEHILIMEGGNDVFAKYHLSTTLNNLRAMVSSSISRGVKTWLGIIPTTTEPSWHPDFFARRMVINQVGLEFADRGVNLVDVDGELSPHWNEEGFSWDGVHLSARANQLLGEAWYRALKGLDRTSPFEEKGGRNCISGSGHVFNAGAVGCSCPSETGDLFKCVDGEWILHGNVGTKCMDIASTNIINYHCDA